MNYYQDNYSMNNRNDYYDDYSRYSKNTYEKDNKSEIYDRFDNKRSCCLRKVEETFCCYPSYYNEYKKEDKKEEKKECNCWEGSFRICPKNENYNHKHDCCNSNKHDCEEKYNHKDEHNSGCRCHNRCCGFCGLFRRW